MQRILFVNSPNQRCGVADYGRRLYSILKQGIEMDYAEADQPFDPSQYWLMLYNYHHATMPHVQKIPGIKQVALFHEAFQNWQPDAWINVADLPRPIIEHIAPFELNNPVPIIGSFGFGFPDKDFPRLAALVRGQYEKAKLRLNIPFAEFGDNDGSLALQEEQKVRVILAGSQIELEVNNQFLNQDELLLWLSQNEINVFLYKQSHGRGISSSTDYALSVGRPIAVSGSEMFKHLPRSICIDNVSIPELIRQGTEPLKQVYEDNSNQKLIEAVKRFL